ncbi:hypothetical protein VTH06DRAFT_4179 [Thermothelomyces fergusii]
MANKQNPFDDGLETEVDDLPLPPPPHVAATIPRFHLYGERECGDHRHDGGHNNGRNNANNSDNGEASRSWPWRTPCTNCHVRATLNQLHDLPCGDLICRECLLVKVHAVRVYIGANHAKIREARKEMRAIDLSFGRRSAPGDGGPAATATATATAMTPTRRRLLRQRHDRLRASVLRMAGLACCGVDMGLHRFLPCLSPDRARELWLALKWVASAPSAQRACGWPNCGAFVPDSCSYALPGDWARRWYCVTCHGNSMECARSLAAAQTRFPFLPKGQLALTPAR